MRFGETVEIGTPDPLMGPWTPDGGHENRWSQSFDWSGSPTIHPASVQRVVFVAVVAHTTEAAPPTIETGDASPTRASPLAMSGRFPDVAWGLLEEARRMTSTELRTHLLTLTAERAVASEIEAVRHAYVGAAVTEIATFRAQLSGPQIG
jgi:hypothetical protein